MISNTADMPTNQCLQGIGWNQPENYSRPCQARNSRYWQSCTQFCSSDKIRNNRPVQTEKLMWTLLVILRRLELRF